jgi:hypothetical protein
MGGTAALGGAAGGAAGCCACVALSAMSHDAPAIAPAAANTMNAARCMVSPSVLSKDAFTG